MNTYTFININNLSEKMVVRGTSIKLENHKWIIDDKTGNADKWFLKELKAERN